MRLVAAVLSLVLLAGVCVAQQSDSRPRDAADPAQAQVDGTADRADSADNDRDWGWIGLLGLAGLLGLRRRRDEVRRDVSDRDVNLRRAG
jgi:MYXO-CTERM domain-containing protein